MRNIDLQKRDEILHRSYITAKDIYNVLPIGINYAARIFNELEAEAKADGIALLATKPRVLPIEYLLRRYPELKGHK